MGNSRTKILNHTAIQASLKRMAFEIYEKNFGLKEILVVGVDFRGTYVARELIRNLESISDLEVVFIHAPRNGEDLPAIDRERWDARIKGKTLILVDDVLYSGRTLFSALAQVVDMEPEGVQVAVLIDRGHRALPIAPDFKGLDLATTLKQHVSVEISASEDRAEAFLQ